MSLENKLDKVLSEALPPRRDPPAANLAGRFPARKQPAAQPAQPTSPQKQKNPDFAAARKAMRKPMVNLDTQIHQIDQMLNVTKKDPSQLGSTVQQIEKSFNALFDPLKQVRTGVQQLKTAAGEFNAEYVGQKEGLPGMKPGQEKPQKRVPGLANKEGRVSDIEDMDEDRFVNKVATSVEMLNNEKGKLDAARKGYEEYQKSGGKMDRGNFFRSLIKKIKQPSEQQEQPQESSVQRRKLV